MTPQELKSLYRTVQGDDAAPEFLAFRERLESYRVAAPLARTYLRKVPPTWKLELRDNEAGLWVYSYHDSLLLVDRRNYRVYEFASGFSA